MVKSVQQKLECWNLVRRHQKTARIADPPLQDRFRFRRRERGWHVALRAGVQFQVVGETRRRNKSAGENGTDKALRGRKSRCGWHSHTASPQFPLRYVGVLEETL